MAKLDVDTLFKNFPLEETIDICVDNFYNDNENPPNIPKHDFRNLLHIATKESFFAINNKCYKQLDSVAIGYRLGPASTNIFMWSFETKGLRNCLNYFRLFFYRCYIDYILVPFSSPDHAYEFRRYFPSKNPTINVSIWKEKDCYLAFLDDIIFPENEKFATKVYKKKTFTGVYTIFKSFA